MLLTLAAALPARAEDFATLVAALGGNSFAEKEQAVVGLGKLGDGRAVAVLTALQDGRLLKAPDGRVLVSDAAKLTDPVSGADLPGIAMRRSNGSASTIACAGSSRGRWAS